MPQPHNRSATWHRTSERGRESARRLQVTGTSCWNGLHQRGNGVSLARSPDSLPPKPPLRSILTAGGSEAHRLNGRISLKPELHSARAQMGERIVSRYHLCGSLIILIATVAGASPSLADDPPQVDLAAATRKPADMNLSDVHGNSVRLGQYAGEKLTVVAFLGTECPLARLYAPRLKTIAAEFADRGVNFVGVNSNCQDSLLEITAYIRRQQVDFPVLKDLNHGLADAVDAQRTPEVFVFDLGWNVQYRGRIDDQYGVGYVRDNPTREDLRLAITALLAGQPVAQPLTASVGCRIGRLPRAGGDNSITYNRHIAGVLREHCVECHRDEEIAPFSLTDYDEVVGWGDTIVEVIQDGRMPPWHANPKYGKFLNQRLMSDDDKQLIYRWVENGAPRGASFEALDLDPALSEPARVTGWRLPREPDQVVAMRDRPYQVATEGIIEYQYFVVDPGFDEDKWVSAAEVVPGNRSVVHHCIVFIRPPDEVGLRGYGWLGAYVPGQVPSVLPSGTARRVPAGSKLVFQMHYTPTGSPQEDLTKIGMLFADPDEIEEETVTMIAINRNFRIPPRTKAYEVKASVEWMPHEGRILSLSASHAPAWSVVPVCRSAQQRRQRRSGRNLAGRPQLRFQLATCLSARAAVHADCRLEDRGHGDI